MGTYFLGYAEGRPSALIILKGWSLFFLIWLAEHGRGRVVADVLRWRHQNLWETIPGESSEDSPMPAVVVVGNLNFFCHMSSIVYSYLSMKDPP